MNSWIPCQVESIQHWHAGLFSLRIQAPNFAFKAGQFARIGLQEGDGKVIARAYSMVNAPGDSTLEFVIARVTEGQLTPRLQRLQVGDEVMLNSHPSGFFTLDHVPAGDTLWMLATGTGIGPYLSILRQDDIWQRFRKVNLVHGVRTHGDLCYAPFLHSLSQRHATQFHYQPVLSRENHDTGALHGRIPDLIGSGALEQACHSVFNTSTQVMLCGNPAMIRDARVVLKDKGLDKHLRRKPGHITMEQYWD